MKIGQLENKAAVSPAVAERKQPAGSGSAARTDAAEPSATVELSSGDLGAADPVFDADKVQRISDAIRDGKFKVNPEAIADKLIANAHELLSPRTRG